MERGKANDNLISGVQQWIYGMECLRAKRKFKWNAAQAELKFKLMAASKQAFTNGMSETSGVK